MRPAFFSLAELLRLEDGLKLTHLAAGSYTEETLAELLRLEDGVLVTTGRKMNCVKKQVLSLIFRQNQLDRECPISRWRRLV